MSFCRADVRPWDHVLGDCVDRRKKNKYHLTDGYREFHRLWGPDLEIDEARAAQIIEDFTTPILDTEKDEWVTPKLLKQTGEDDFEHVEQDDLAQLKLKLQDDIIENEPNSRILNHPRQDTIGHDNWKSIRGEERTKISESEAIDKMRAFEIRGRLYMRFIGHGERWYCRPANVYDVMKNTGGKRKGKLKDDNDYGDVSHGPTNSFGLNTLEIVVGWYEAALFEYEIKPDCDHQACQSFRDTLNFKKLFTYRRKIPSLEYMNKIEFAAYKDDVESLARLWKILTESHNDSPFEPGSSGGGTGNVPSGARSAGQVFGGDSFGPPAQHNADGTSGPTSQARPGNSQGFQPNFHLYMSSPVWDGYECPNSDDDDSSSNIEYQSVDGSYNDSTVATASLTVEGSRTDSLSKDTGQASCNSNIDPTDESVDSYSLSTATWQDRSMLSNDGYDLDSIPLSDDPSIASWEDRSASSVDSYEKIKLPYQLDAITEAETDSDDPSMASWQERSMLEVPDDDTASISDTASYSSNSWQDRPMLEASETASMGPDRLMLEDAETASLSASITSWQDRSMYTAKTGVSNEESADMPSHVSAHTKIDDDSIENTQTLSSYKAAEITGVAPKQQDHSLKRFWSKLRKPKFRGFLNRRRQGGIMSSETCCNEEQPRNVGDHEPTPVEDAVEAVRIKDRRINQKKAQTLKAQSAVVAYVGFLLDRQIQSLETPEPIRFDSIDNKLKRRINEKIEHHLREIEKRRHSDTCHQPQHPWTTTSM